MKKLILALGLTVLGFAATATVQDRSGGFRIGQRTLLRPYVSFSYTYDSNADSSSKNSKGSHSFSVSPGFNLDYNGDQFEVNAAAWYQYHAYTRYADSRNNHTYGETLTFSWHDGPTAESDAWSFLLSESYSRISQDDDMMNDGGRGVGRDRDQFNVNATLNRNFTEKFHGSVYGGFYLINYDNDTSAYAPMYGWNRWTAGAETGYRLSRWTDFLLTGNYQGYMQDNTGPSVWDTPERRRSYGSHSDSWTVHVGVGSAFTERISYRVTGGITAYKYADTGWEYGFTYNASCRWKITDTWNTMLLASSYYQPSERAYGAATRNDTVSWGLAHSMLRGKLTASLDLAYRHETQIYSDMSSNDYSTDILTGRVGLDYTIWRYFAVFGRVEYQTEFDRGGAADQHDWDYDRWRLTVGFRLQY